jgi:hypothetical protein
VLTRRSPIGSSPTSSSGLEGGSNGGRSRLLHPSASSWRARGRAAVAPLTNAYTRARETVLRRGRSFSRLNVGRRPAARSLSQVLHVGETKGREEIYAAIPEAEPGGANFWGLRRDRVGRAKNGRAGFRFRAFARRGPSRESRFLVAFAGFREVSAGAAAKKQRDFTQLRHSLRAPPRIFRVFHDVVPFAFTAGASLGTPRGGRVDLRRVPIRG